tara:strand:- start:221 stop:385 length:165 start_codon:yes stop_codon:yes gene_type:complete
MDGPDQLETPAVVIGAIIINRVNAIASLVRPLGIDLQIIVAVMNQSTNLSETGE